jgi:zeaxanthin glucosyltransferase
LRHSQQRDRGPKGPQIELLKRASLCITHAGLNTALESLAQGVPLLAIPIGFDQLGVAARITYPGVGKSLETEDVHPERLPELIHAVRKNPSYRQRARYFRRVIARTHGLDLAADVIEQALFKNGAANLANTGAKLSPA